MTDRVRGKFFVQAVTRHAYNPTHAQVGLMPVTRGEDNREWAAATPAGQINMTVQNGDVADFFALGEEFYVDFTPAPKGQKG